MLSNNSGTGVLSPVHKGGMPLPSGVQCSGGWRKDEARELGRVSALCSLQCFDKYSCIELHNLG